MNITKQQYEELMEKLVDKITHDGGMSIEDSMGIYHVADTHVEGEQVYEYPLLIGDVLEKIEESLDRSILDDLWLPFGQSNSLQIIVEENGWKEALIPVPFEKVVILKSPEANELLSYLYSLFCKQ